MVSAKNINRSTPSASGNPSPPNTPANSSISGGKQIPLVGTRAVDTYASLFPNAIPSKAVVWAKDTALDLWRQASIIHARKRVEEYHLEQNSYTYYIHWQGLDRRLDTWVEYENICSLDEGPPKDQTFVEPSDAHDDEHAGLDEEYLREHEENTKVKTINKLFMGQHLVDNWYFSPYPKEFQNIAVICVCEYCLSFFREETELKYHADRCELRHPPGNEIYRDTDIAMFELDGAYCKTYCENLSYLSKLFLDHKTLRHPVNLFLFYVMTEIHPEGYQITGYFSKEKYSKNNVSCILTLPQHQRKGYGKFLINFSYALSKVEEKSGTPERPLSDLGKASYMAYWAEKLFDLLIVTPEPISVQEMSHHTRIETADIITCLEELGVLRYTDNGDYYISLQNENVESLQKLRGRATRAVIMENLHWVPYDPYFRPYEYGQQ